MEHLLHLVGVDFDALSEGEVVGNEVKAAAYVAGIVEAAHYFLCYVVLAGSEGAHGELSHEMVKVGVLRNEDSLVGVLVLVPFLSFAVAVVIVVSVYAHQVVALVATFGQGFHHVAGSRGDFQDGVFLDLLF